ncbi:hypothetical protein [Alkalihalobacillus sp. BA299]|uniref:hypothetical protein n=1 Tax=Alkalihalobacillus sp. BA299 TaxID=2815938 RepID=UPI001ADB9C57|nr:hypothetical protein [Alkalihalobacillus sp. BA299]
MQKKLLFILFGLLLFGGSVGYAKAGDHYNELYWKPQSIEKQYQIMGYQSIQAAVKKFETLYQKKVSLPTKKPPIEITHSFGIIDSYSYPPKLEIEYINEERPKEQIKMFVIPEDQGIYKKAPVAQLYTLDDGGKAIQLRDRYHNILIFQKGGWEYILANSKRIEEKVSIHDLIDMANSIGEKD